MKYYFKLATLLFAAVVASSFATIPNSRLLQETNNDLEMIHSLSKLSQEQASVIQKQADQTRAMVSETGIVPENISSFNTTESIPLQASRPIILGKISTLNSMKDFSKSSANSKPLNHHKILFSYLNGTLMVLSKLLVLGMVAILVLGGLQLSFLVSIGLIGVSIPFLGRKCSHNAEKML